MKRTFIGFIVVMMMLGLSGCKISGTVTENGVGIEGVHVTLSGGVDMTATTDQDGYYEFNFEQSDPGKNHYTVTPDREGYRFLPENRTVQFTASSSAIGNVDFVAEIDQRQALIQLYNSTNGDQWFINDGWKTPPLAADGFAMPGTEDHWWGLEYDDEVNDTVLAIRLENNGLTGTLPDTIGALSDLYEIDLSGNRIGGPIPASIGALEKLRMLSLSDNELWGLVPTELMSMPALQYLDIAQNHLCTEDPALMEFLDIYAYGWREQKLDTECEPVREALMELYEATGGPNWNHNGNWGTDADISTWYGVQPYGDGKFGLDLHDNNLDGPLPASIAELTGLNYLNLRGNALTGSLPDNIGDLVNLQYLELSYNQLSGPIPESVGDLGNLQFLYLNGNGLNGMIPPSVMNLPNATMELGINHLCTKDPALIEFLDSHTPGWRDQKLDTECEPVREILMELYEATDGPNWNSSNNWGTDADISTWYGVLVLPDGKFQLDLGSNNLNGPLPPSIAELTSLQSLNLYSNALTGSLPENIGDLVNLTHLDLSNNQLSGPIPESIGAIVNLSYLGLNENNLNGRIPLSITNLSNISFFQLEFNHLCSQDPAIIEFLDSHTPGWRDQKLDTECEPVREILMELYEATGGPNWNSDDNWGTDADISTWFGVQIFPGGKFDLDLYNNSLNGPLPPSIAELTSLQSLNLYGNALTGSLPENIGDLVNLRFLDLSNNQLSGPIPESIGALVNLNDLALMDNNLTGLIPTSIMSLTRTNILLDYNHLCARDPALIEFLDNHASWREQKLDTECEPVRRVLMELYEATGGPNWNSSDNWGTDADINTWYGVQVFPDGKFQLDLYNNNLNGPLPPSIAELTSLQSLNLYGNALTGTLPENIGDLVNLHFLDLSNNQLSGPIPESIGALVNLNDLMLMDNNLTGLIPASIMNLTSTNIQLNYNHLCAQDPALIDFLDNHAAWREQKPDTICEPAP